MTQTIESVQVNNLTVLCDPKLFNYGQMRDHCEQFTYEFNSGKIYGVIGECGSGGWALSYCLSGKVKAQHGEIVINQSRVDQNQIINYGSYVGEGTSSRMFFKERTVRQQIKQGLERRNSKYTFQEIVDLFELSSSRLNRSLRYISNERWNASIAIGLANGKSIFCFPWLSTGWIQSIQGRINTCARILKDRGAIIIIPTSKKDTLNDIADYSVEIC
ncbi:ATP-binding cassette domain-containing protein [Paenibacillus sp. FJAT-26967]|uniref:ATP-binding cassette domain-containing protein n=1 Tax=Paenibacillus sp. FJAT-26967 TaxID=1729690 RepID=UPI0009FE6C7F|nr:ATP-binding cassette domain-containing protein [Paenibacillus sp. FJAT-26967]